MLRGRRPARRAHAAGRRATCPSAPTRAPTAGRRVRRALRQGGGLRRGQDRDGRHLAAASPTSARASRGRARSSPPASRSWATSGLTPQSASALGGFKAQGRDGAAGGAGRRRRARAPGRGLLRDRVRGGPGRGHRDDHGADAGPGDRHRRRAPRPTARCSSSTTCSASTTGHAPRFAKRFAEVKPRDGRGRPGLRRRGARAPVPGRRAHLQHRPGRAGALPRDRRPGQALGRRGRSWPKRRLPATAPRPMAVHSAQIRVSTEGNGDIIDITKGVQEVVETAGISGRHRERLRRPLDGGGHADRVRARRRAGHAGPDGPARAAGRRLQPQPHGGRHERPLAPPGRDRRPVGDRAGEGRPPASPAPGSSSCSSTSTTTRGSGPSWCR